MELSAIKKLVEENVLQDTPDYDLVRQKFDKLMNAGFITKESSNNYAFKDSVTWEIVYETLLYSERRHLHDLIALHIEKNKADELNHYAARLVYHYDNAENKKKTAFYSALAGEYAYSLFAIDDALGFYNKSMINLEAIGGKLDVDKSMLLEHQADVKESIGSLSDAIDAYKSSIDILGNNTRSGRSYLPWNPQMAKRKSILNHKLSVAYERNLNYVDALKHLDEAEYFLPKKSGLLPVKINATRGVIRYRKLEYDSAHAYASESLEIAKKKKSYKDIAYANNIIANIHLTQGNVDRSIKYFKQALSMYTKINDINGMSMSYYNLATSVACIPDFEAAHIYYSKSLEINKKTQNKLAMLQDCFMIGNNKIFTQEYDVALSYFDDAIELYNSGVDRKDFYGIALSRIAEVYAAKNNLDKAEEYIQQSISILSELEQLPDKLAQAKIILIDIRIKQGELQEAESLCHSLIQEFTDMKIMQLVVHVKKQLGQIYVKQRKYDEALKVLESAINIATDIDSMYDKHILDLHVINVKILKHDIDNSLESRLQKLSDHVRKFNSLDDIEFLDEVVERFNKNK